MKPILLIMATLFFFTAVSAQKQKKPVSEPDPAKPVLSVKASCGQCMFGMSGNDCTLAVKIKRKTYFVEGTTIDDHGDSHAKDGFCNMVRKAEVQGEVIANKFLVSYFKLIGTNDKN